MNFVNFKKFEKYANFYESPLMEPRNLSDIFAGCELHGLSSAAFGIDLMRSCRILKGFLMFDDIPCYCSQASNHQRHYCCHLFPAFLLRLLCLGTIKSCPLFSHGFYYLLVSPYLSTTPSFFQPMFYLVCY